MPSLRLLLPLVVGMLLAYMLPLPHCPYLWTVAAAVALALALATVRIRSVSSFSLIAFSFSLGALLMQREKEKMLSSPQHEKVEYEAVVLSNPVQKGKTVRFDAYVLAVKGYAVEPFKAKVLVYSPERALPLAVGATIYASSVFTKPVQFGNSNFDYPRYLFSQGFSTQTLVFSDNIRTCLNPRTQTLPKSVGFEIKLAGFRNELRGKLSAMGVNGDNLAVLSALTLGDKSLLHTELREAYSVSGASHVLALSGLHLGIIFSILTMFFDAFGMLRWWRVLSRFFVIATVWGYVLMVGMPTSAVRSAIMLTVCSLVAVSGRDTKTLNSLTLAAILILLANPMSLFDVGFQMSFVAVAFIVLFAVPVVRYINRSLGNRLVILKWAAGMVAVSFAAQMGVAPLVAYYFGRFSCFFLITNFVAIPITVILLYGSVAMACLFFSAGLQQTVATVLNDLVRFLNSALFNISSWSGSSVEGINLNVWQVVVAYVIMFLLRYAFCLWMDNIIVRPFKTPYPDVPRR